MLSGFNPSLRWSSEYGAPEMQYQRSYLQGEGLCYSGSTAQAKVFCWASGKYSCCSAARSRYAAASGHWRRSFKRCSGVKLGTPVRRGLSWLYCRSSLRWPADQAPQAQTAAASAPLCWCQRVAAGRVVVKASAKVIREVIEEKAVQRKPTTFRTDLPKAFAACQPVLLLLPVAG